MSTPVSGVNTQTAANATNNSSSSSSSSTSGIDKLANEQTFLQLFVSQLQNQDPLNPADGTQFVTQLAQFSQLEQMLNISGDVSAIRQQIAPSSSSTTSTSSSTSASGS